MSDSFGMLTASEAAVVSCVSLRDVNRAIDEHILPHDFRRLDGTRMVKAAGCALISFYFASAKRLTADERLFVIGLAGDKLLTTGFEEKQPEGDWSFHDEFLTVDLKPFLKAASERLGTLAAARQIVTMSRDVLGGTPVVKGTRVPVHDVAASLESGRTPHDVLAAYPSLKSAQLELCRLYAQAYPARGRPRRMAAPTGAKVLIDRRVPRRKMM